MFSLFGYTFTGLPPAAAAGLAAGATAALIALYLLRERQRRARVAFVALWEGPASRRRLEHLGRRLRRWLSLFLQLTILALLLAALTDPRAIATAGEARTWMVLVDRSASMSARDAPTTTGAADRLAGARQQAKRLLAGLGAGDRTMVASFARQPTAETGLETDPSRLEAAVDAIVPSEEPGDLGRALALAAAVLRGRPRPTLVVIGDGAYSPATAPSDLGGVDVRFVRVGTPGDNVALLSFSARRRPLDPSTVDIGLVVQNFGAAPRTLTVEILAGIEARPIERMALTLEPGGRTARTLTHVLAREAELEARLVFPDGQDDLLPTDDRAFAVVPEEPRRRVLVVGAGNLYLDGALLSFGNSLTVQRVAAAATETTRAQWPAWDAVIFDGIAPAPAPTSGRFLYLNPLGGGSPFPIRGAVADPVPSDANRQHPLLAHLSLADLNIRQARRLVPAPGDEIVATSFGAPLLIARARPGFRAVALPFDLRHSDLPLRPIFPLLLANVFEWLDGRAIDAQAMAGQRTGQLARVPVPASATLASVTAPNGSSTQQVALAGTIEVLLEQCGFYRVSFRGRAGLATPLSLAANLSDPTESDTRAQPRLALAGRPQPEWRVPQPAPARDWALWAALAAFTLSLFEWWSYHRRWTV